MRVAIVGSRTFTDERMVRQIVARLQERHEELTIVSGGARGVDTFAAQAAMDRGVRVQVFPAEWDRYGKRAGYLRNVTIVENADMVIALFAPGPRSKGTSHTVNIAREQHKTVCEYHEGRWTKSD